jgi:hypothetical protein
MCKKSLSQGSLKALIERESAKRLASLSSSEPQLTTIPGSVENIYKDQITDSLIGFSFCQSLWLLAI